MAKTLLLLFLCLVSCQNEKEDFNDSGKDISFNILPIFQQHKIEISTKALTGYSEYTPEDGELIYAWAQRYFPTDSLIEGEFRRSSGKWYSSVEVKSSHKYKLFAFHPGGISDNRGTFAQSNGDFTLTVDSIKILTYGEPSIAVAADRSYYDNNSSRYTRSNLTPGSYDLGAISSNSYNKDRALLAMNLIYSKVNMSFTLDTVYSKLRSVVITGVKMVSDKGLSSMSLTFDETSTPTWGAYKDSAIVFSLPIPNDSIVLSKTTTTKWNGNNFDGYQHLDAGSFCYLPKSDLPVKLSVTYNVYTGDIIADPLTPENYEDRLTRKGQTAINSSIMPKGNNIPKAGTYYNVKIKVIPSYLYQLSDDDLDSKLPIE